MHRNLADIVYCHKVLKVIMTLSQYLCQHDHINTLNDD